MLLYEYEAFPSPKRVRMFMAEKGIQGVKFHQIDVPGGEHRQESFQTKNPYGTVPTLELEDGTCLSETVAISRYFEEIYPDNSLMGKTAREKAMIEMWQRRVEQTLYDSIAAYFHHGTPGLGGLETYQNKEWGKKNLTLYMDALHKIDKRLSRYDYICGDEFTIVDITTYCAIYFASLIDIAIPKNLTHLNQWHKEISARPSARA